ncbi:MAG: SDR family NAD(P)-dependent oxidoreductase [Dehalococcoidales bacterium]|nr:SDR family NAD(P)-dependent oxidoreductase [Dehalococcoidales bacterium]
MIQTRSILSGFSLDGKRALVTEGKMGFGRAITLGFADAGAGFGICGRMLTNSKLGVAVAEISQSGRRSLAIQADVTSKTDVERMVKQVVTTEFGSIDILVKNAAIY